MRKPFRSYKYTVDTSHLTRRRLMTTCKMQQLRLLLPDEWIPELDILARARYLTRLGLIRFYLRTQMNEELAELPKLFEAQKARNVARKQLEAYLDDFEM